MKIKIFNLLNFLKYYNIIKLKNANGYIVAELGKTQDTQENTRYVITYFLKEFVKYQNICQAHSL